MIDLNLKINSLLLFTASSLLVAFAATLPFPDLTCSLNSLPARNTGTREA